MTTKQLNEWIAQPQTLNQESLEILRRILDNHPYFQTVRLLYLQNLYLLHDERFGDELRKAALHITNRRVLFNLLHTQFSVPLIEENKKNIVEEEEEEEEELSLDRTLQVINSFLLESPQKNATALTYNTVSDYTVFIENELKDKQPEVSEKQDKKNLIVSELPLVQEQIKEESEKEEQVSQDSMQELQNIQAEIQEQTATIENNSDSIEIIDRFIEEQEDIKRTEKRTKKGNKLTANEVIDQSKSNNEEISPNLDQYNEEECLTETLAKIYIRQHKFSKALEIFKKLSLKYPKKSAYFADQIRFLEKLITNIKSE